MQPNGPSLSPEALRASSEKYARVRVVALLQRDLSLDCREVWLPSKRWCNLSCDDLEHMYTKINAQLVRYAY